MDGSLLPTTTRTRKGRDVNVDDPRRYARDVVPDAFEDLRAGQQPTVRFAQKPQQTKLERGQIDRFPVFLQRVQIAYEGRVADLQTAVAVAGARALATPQERGDARDQLVPRERLGDVVVRPEAEAGQLDVLARMPADHQDVRVGGLGDRRADVEPRHVGQADVEKHDVRPVLAHELEPFLARLGDAGVITRAREHELLERCYVGIVLDDQDAGHGLIRAHVPRVRRVRPAPLRTPRFRRPASAGARRLPRRPQRRRQPPPHRRRAYRTRWAPRIPDRVRRR